jgi:hypothetical protein
MPNKLQGPSSSEEFRNLLRQISKTPNQTITSIHIASFPDQLREIKSKIQPNIKKLSDQVYLPRQKHLQEILEYAQINNVPLFACGRHHSHTFVRFGWIAWSSTNEFLLFMRNIFHFPQKFLTEFGYSFYSKTTPTLAKILYEEPAEHVVSMAVKEARDLTQSNSVSNPSLHVLVIHPNIETPVVQYVSNHGATLLAESPENLNERIQELSAKGSPYYWMLVLQWYFMIPLLCLSIFFRLLERNFSLKEQWLGGFFGRDRSVDNVEISGTFGSRWLRDKSRD